MREITVTNYDGDELTVDADAIDFVNIALNECTIHFVDGSSLRVKQTFEEVSRRIKDAK